MNKIKIIEDSFVQEDTFNYYCKYDYEGWKPPQSRINMIQHQIGDSSNKIIVDVGCGAYPVTQTQAAKKKIGIDISLPAIEKSLEYFDQAYVLDLEGWKLEQTPELVGVADVVVVSETFEHFENIYEIALKLKQLLKPTGMMIVTYPNHFSLSMYIDYIFHGFKFVRFSDFIEGHFTFYHKNQLDFIFRSSGFDIAAFDYRPCDIVPEKFPKESSNLWKKITSIYPKYFAHQFIYVLQLQPSPATLFSKRYSNYAEKTKTDISNIEKNYHLPNQPIQAA